MRREWEAEKKRWERDGRPGLLAQENGGEGGPLALEEEASEHEEENQSLTHGSKRSSARHHSNVVKSEPSSKADTSALDDDDTGTSPDHMDAQDEDRPKRAKRRRVDKSAGIRAEAKEET